MKKLISIALSSKLIRRNTTGLETTSTYLNYAKHLAQSKTVADIFRLLASADDYTTIISPTLLIRLPKDADPSFANCLALSFHIYQESKKNEKDPIYTSPIHYISGQVPDQANEIRNCLTKDSLLLIRFSSSYSSQVVEALNRYFETDCRNNEKEPIRCRIVGLFDYDDLSQGVFSEAFITRFSYTYSIKPTSETALIHTPKPPDATEKNLYMLQKQIDNDSGSGIRLFSASSLGQNGEWEEKSGSSAPVFELFSHYKLPLLIDGVSPSSSVFYTLLKNRWEKENTTMMALPEIYLGPFIYPNTPSPVQVIRDPFNDLWKHYHIITSANFDRFIYYAQATSDLDNRVTFDKGPFKKAHSTITTFWVTHPLLTSQWRKLSKAIRRYHYSVIVSDTIPLPNDYVKPSHDIANNVKHSLTNNQKIPILTSLSIAYPTLDHRQPLIIQAKEDDIQTALLEITSLSHLAQDKSKIIIYKDPDDLVTETLTLSTNSSNTHRPQKNYIYRATPFQMDICNKHHTIIILGLEKNTHRLLQLHGLLKSHPSIWFNGNDHEVTARLIFIMTHSIPKHSRYVIYAPDDRYRLSTNHVTQTSVDQTPIMSVLRKGNVGDILSLVETWMDQRTDGLPTSWKSLERISEYMCRLQNEASLDNDDGNILNKQLDTLYDIYSGILPPSQRHALAHYIQKRRISLMPKTNDDTTQTAAFRTITSALNSFLAIRSKRTLKTPGQRCLRIVGESGVGKDFAVKAFLKKHLYTEEKDYKYLNAGFLVTDIESSIKEAATAGKILIISDIDLWKKDIISSWIMPSFKQCDPKYCLIITVNDIGLAGRRSLPAEFLNQTTTLILDTPSENDLKILLTSNKPSKDMNIQEIIDKYQKLRHTIRTPFPRPNFRQIKADAELSTTDHSPELKAAIYDLYKSLPQLKAKRKSLSDHWQDLNYLQALSDLISPHSDPKLRLNIRLGKETLFHQHRHTLVMKPPVTESAFWGFWLNYIKTKHIFPTLSSTFKAFDISKETEPNESGQTNCSPLTQAPNETPITPQDSQTAKSNPTPAEKSDKASVKPYKNVTIYTNPQSKEDKKTTLTEASVIHYPYTGWTYRYFTHFETLLPRVIKKNMPEFFGNEMGMNALQKHTNYGRINVTRYRHGDPAPFDTVGFGISSAPKTVILLGYPLILTKDHISPGRNPFLLEEWFWSTLFSLNIPIKIAVRNNDRKLHVISTTSVQNLKDSIFQHNLHFLHLPESIKPQILQQEGVSSDSVLFLQAKKLNQFIIRFSESIRSLIHHHDTNAIGSFRPKKIECFPKSAAKNIDGQPIPITTHTIQLSRREFSTPLHLTSSHLPLLEEVYLAHTHYLERVNGANKTLDLSQCPNLRVLHLRECKLFEKVILPSPSVLRKLDIHGSTITAIDVGHSQDKARIEQCIPTTINEPNKTSIPIHVRKNPHKTMVRSQEDFDESFDVCVRLHRDIANS